MLVGSENDKKTLACMCSAVRRPTRPSKQMNMFWWVSKAIDCMLHAYTVQQSNSTRAQLPTAFQFVDANTFQSFLVPSDVHVCFPLWWTDCCSTCCSSTVYHYHTLTTYVVVGIGICTTSYFKSAVGRHFTLECCPIFQLIFFYISNFDNWILQKLPLFDKFSFALGSQYLH